MCPCRDLLDMVASKWTALVIGDLEDGPKRFGELKRRLEGVSQKMLTQTLRTLERDGLVTRTVYPSVPLRVEYELTELGRSVTEPLAALRLWAQKNYESVAEARETFDGSEPLGLEPATAR
ncbi:helix-turn-helix transcriptional regulator [Lentzea sp. NBC_00516]|uniref:winged helix-turn-helix transcriptional regulator n=1 Tax=Lentzea sp. NBC_00516 TaxID=2903582 RepID=UPI002E801378|nr:helix-turn-helix domain-containing protein [Lentzea sp. NBC_00516]WUD29893.1 helix-turn-helix transcriptional regulator [Lentzea sp. NBC_00516]